MVFCNSSCWRTCLSNTENRRRPSANATHRRTTLRWLALSPGYMAGIYWLSSLPGDDPGQAGLAGIIAWTHLPCRTCCIYRCSEYWHDSGTAPRVHGGCAMRQPSAPLSCWPRGLVFSTNGINCMYPDATLPSPTSG